MVERRMRDVCRIRDVGLQHSQGGPTADSHVFGGGLRYFDPTSVRTLLAALCLGATLSATSGCGGGADDPSSSVDEATAAAKPSGNAAEPPPVAAIGVPEPASTASPTAAEPGSPEALLIQIAQLIADANREVDGQADAAGSADDSAEPTNVDSSAAYRRRLEKIVDLSTQVVAATHQQPEMEQHFNNAVHYLSDARLELASAGDEVHAQLLIEDAETLYSRDSDSFAAAEAGFKVVELAHRMADSFGSEDSDWVREYARQTLQFAERFPAEEGRAAMSLFSAGRLCDREKQPTEALKCFRLLREQHTTSVFAEQSAGFLRRLTLVGQPLELSGPTIDGGFFEIAQYRGRVVLVVFWKSDSGAFQEHLETLRQIETQSAGRPLTILGVNLDVDEATVDRFLAGRQIGWPQVFSSDPNQRGGRNPVARYYSVQATPIYWLVDPSGIVVESTADPAGLAASVRTLLDRRK